MSVRTLDKLWGEFREKQRLGDAYKPQQEALEYAFKCAVAASMLMIMDLSHMPQERQTAIVHDIMNDFGEYVKERMARSANTAASKTLN